MRRIRDNMSNEMGSAIDRLLGRSSGWRIVVFGLIFIIIASIINYYESSPTAIAIAVLGFFMMIRGYSQYSAEIQKDQKSDEE
jgi:uncharacterized membrane protein